MQKPFRVGAQVTLQTSDHRLKEKLEKRAYSLTKLKLFGLNDYRVMSFPGFPTRHLYEQWVLYGKPPGGPEALLDNQVKVKLFSKVLKSALRSKSVDRTISKEYFEKGKASLILDNSSSP